MASLFGLKLSDIENVKSYDLPGFLPQLSSKDYIVLDMLIETLIDGNSTEFRRFLNASSELDVLDIEYIETNVPWPAITKTNYDESLVVLNKIIEIYATATRS